MSRLVDAIVDADRSIELVALGGDAKALPGGMARVDEPPHLPTNLGWTLVGIPQAAIRARVDLIHAPAYTCPFLASVPVVLSVHDVSYVVHPQWSPHPIGPLRQWFYRRSATSATRILTISDFSAAEIVRVYGIPRERISVSPLGVDRFFSPTDGDLPEALPASVREPYLLHVGDLHERRNLGVIVEALTQVRRNFGTASALSLVLAGVDRGLTAGLREMSERAGIGNAVVPLGEVSDDQLRRLYRDAAALVYPSLYEGFGLPLIEAMACGTPVIGSNCASIPEVLGGAGVIVEANDAAAWSRAIIDVVNSAERRAALRAAGLARAARFTWQQTAEVTIATYKQALAS